jgi:methyl coenzyme M reductase gamma subunit
VDGRLIVELKAIREIVDEQVAQILGHLKFAREEHGLLINLGTHKSQIKKCTLNEQGPRTTFKDLANLPAFPLGTARFFL